MFSNAFHNRKTLTNFMIITDSPFPPASANWPRFSDIIFCFERTAMFFLFLYKKA